MYRKNDVSPNSQRCKNFSPGQNDSEITKLENIAWVLRITKGSLEDIKNVSEDEQYAFFEEVCITLKNKIEAEFDNDHGIVDHIGDILTELANIDGLEKKEKKFLKLYKNAGSSTVSWIWWVLIVGAIGWALGEFGWYGFFN